MINTNMAPPETGRAPLGTDIAGDPSETIGEPKWISLGHPSYVWRSGQDRRLNLIRHYVSLENKRILDVGCGIGTYLRKFQQFTNDVYGVDVDSERAVKARQAVPNVAAAPAETLPFADESFDVVLLHEVIEHVDDDYRAVGEAVRVAKCGGNVVIYAPNRLYPFETHGAYFGGRYVFGLIPLVNYLPDSTRKYFCPHVRAYSRRALCRLFADLPVKVVALRGVYPGFDNIAARSSLLAGSLRRILYAAENTSLQAFGLSHFLVLEKARNSIPKSFIAAG